MLRSVMIAAAICFTSFPCVAAPFESERGAGHWFYEAKFGVLAHDVDGLWSGFRRESGFDFNGEVVFGWNRALLPYAVLRPNLGVSINNGDDTSKLYGGFVIEVDLPAQLFLAFGAGITVHDGETETRDPDKKELGSHLLFRIPIEIGFQAGDQHRFSIMFDHISNAYLASPNEGLDTLGVRYGYRF